MFGVEATMAKRLLKTLPTVSIHERLAGGLADIAPIGKFIVEGGTADERLSLRLRYQRSLVMENSGGFG